MERDTVLIIIGCCFFIIFFLLGFLGLYLQSFKLFTGSAICLGVCLGYVAVLIYQKLCKKNKCG